MVLWQFLASVEDILYASLSNQSFLNDLEGI